jgi:hypothetical protein
MLPVPSLSDFISTLFPFVNERFAVLFFMVVSIQAVLDCTSLLGAQLLFGRNIVSVAICFGHVSIATMIFPF